MGKNITIKVGDELKNFQGVELTRFLTPGGDNLADYLNVELLPNTYVFGFGENYNNYNAKILANLTGIIATGSYSHFNIFIRIDNSFYPAGIVGSDDREIFSFNEDGTVVYSIKYTKSDNSFTYFQESSGDVSEVYTRLDAVERSVYTNFQSIVSLNNRVVESEETAQKAFDDIDKQINETAVAVEQNTTDIQTLETKVSDLLYKKIDITNFSHVKSTFEIGGTVTVTTLQWTINKVPKQLFLDGVEIASTGTNGSKTVADLDVTSDRKWTLEAVDERGASDTYDAWIRFYRGVYYGTSKDGDIIDNSFVSSLTKKLQGNKKFDFEITPADDEYIVIAVPSSYGIPSITIDGWTYTWDKIAEFNFRNSSNYTEQYSVYRSEKGGGTSHVFVS